MLSASKGEQRPNAHRESLRDIEDRTHNSRPLISLRRGKASTLADIIRDKLIQRKLRKPGKIMRVR